jgi:methionyl-tRNA formyltransferase
MSKSLRIVFLGSDPIALPLLDWLAAHPAEFELAAVFTQPDRATGRGQAIVANAIKTWALGRRLPVLQPARITPETVRELGALTPDLALVMAYGHILKDDFIETARLGTLNLHTSLLPKYRGASPIQTAVARGDPETGVTLMRIVRRLDAGPVADVERVPIGPLETAADVERKLAAACVPLLARALPRLAAGTLGFTPQDDAAATYCRKLEKSDGRLDFAAPAAALASRINGLFPWPSCQILIHGQQVKIGLADAVAAKADASPGRVLGQDGDGLRISTGDGIVRFRRLQRPGGRMLPAAEFLRGFAVPAGTLLPSQSMPELLAPPPRPRAA